jgi:hypothetical protein
MAERRFNFVFCKKCEVREIYDTRRNGGIKMSDLPILFNTAMVKAIIKLIKKSTRRPIKIKFLHGYNPEWTGYRPIFEYGKFFLANSKGEPATKEVKAPCKIGDTLWVRETWQLLPSGFDEMPPEYRYIYKASDILSDECTSWRPSIHMPRKAARIHLKVTDVRVERIREIKPEDCMKEGVNPSINPIYDTRQSYYAGFKELWENIYHNWDDNPWAWVIEFERKV